MKPDMTFYNRGLNYAKEEIEDQNNNPFKTIADKNVVGSGTFGMGQVQQDKIVDSESKEDDEAEEDVEDQKSEGFYAQEESVDIIE